MRGQTYPFVRTVLGEGNVVEPQRRDLRRGVRDVRELGGLGRRANAGVWDDAGRREHDVAQAVGKGALLVLVVPFVVGVTWRGHVVPALRDAGVGVRLAGLSRERLVGARDEVRRLDDDEDREKRGERGQEAAERGHASRANGVSAADVSFSTARSATCSAATLRSAAKEI